MQTFSSRIHFLDGIRGWAALIVVFNHITMCFMPETWPGVFFTKEWLLDVVKTNAYLEAAGGIFARVITDGRFAVLLFFVVSGYALSASQLNLQTRNLALATTARYFRLMIPILVTSFIAYLLLSGGMFYHQAVAASNPDYYLIGTFYQFEPNIKHLLSFSLIHTFLNYDFAASYNPVLWTMPFELIGSFMIYAYLGMFRTTETVQWKVGILAAIALLIIKPLFACFILGYLIAEIQRHANSWNTNWIARHKETLLISIFVVSAALSTCFRTEERFACLLAASMVFAVACSANLKGFFSNRLSHFLGKISFPIYLIHVPIICSWSSLLYLQLSPTMKPEIMLIMISLSTLMLCLLASVALLPVERASITYSKRIGRLFLKH